MQRPAFDTDLRWSVTQGQGVTMSYSYDALSRLTGASGGQSYTYGYDNNGNLTNDNAVTQAFNGANELCWSYAGSSSNTCSSPPAGSTKYSYDADGQETGNSAGLSFSYDPKNHTTSVTPPGGQALNMTYSGAIQTERITAGSTSFTYNVLGCGGASTGTSGNTAYTRDNKGQLLEERLPSGTSYTPYYYLFDGLGSVVGLTDGSGTLQNSYTYGPYGEKRSWTENVSNPWHFAGGYLDASTGLYKFGMRYYDPSIGRWTQEDSHPGPQPYAYASNDPTNHVDPSGAQDINWSEVLQHCGMGGLFGMAVGFVAGPEDLPGIIVGGIAGCIAGAYVNYLEQENDWSLAFGVEATDDLVAILLILGA
jgi:RHS repeat-associated protein